MSPSARPDAAAAAQALMRAQQRLDAGDLGAAEAACREVLGRDPRSTAALHLLGLTAHRAGDLGAAVALVGQAARAQDATSACHANLCELLRLSGRLDEALAAGRRAVALDPCSANALNNLGIVHFDRGEPALAAEHYRRAIAVSPGLASAHSNLGNALRAERSFDAAIAAYRRALALDPGHADAWSNLGAALNVLGRRDEAMQAYRAAIAHDPLHANAHTGLALQLLLRGRFDEGWHEYEWRWRSSEVPAGRAPVRAWQGDDIAGRRILVRCEQGLGDALQFCRYAPVLAARGAGVVISAPRPLVRLLAASLDCAVVADDEAPPACDVECSIMSLPLLLATGEDPYGDGRPYLSAPGAAVAAWRARLAGDQALSVGLAWAGNPLHVNDHARSIAPARLAPLLDVEGVRWVSLQIDRKAAGPAPAAMSRLADISTWIGDFLDTAAAVAALDLVICVDTAVAHLAGALGAPAWVLLPVGGDWRWGMEGEVSAWSPSLRLFRQADYGDWAPVIARVAGELRVRVQGGP